MCVGTVHTHLHAPTCTHSLSTYSLLPHAVLALLTLASFWSLPPSLIHCPAPHPLSVSLISSLTHFLLHPLSHPLALSLIFHLSLYHFHPRLLPIINSHTIFPFSLNISCSYIRSYWASYSLSSTPTSIIENQTFYLYFSIDLTQSSSPAFVAYSLLHHSLISRLSTCVYVCLSVPFCVLDWVCLSVIVCVCAFI